jgi:hypothetical protein
MLLRFKKNPGEEFSASQLNVHALAEVLTGDDSAPVGELECWLEAGGEWKCLSLAFRAGDVITDNYNTEFREPRDAAERERGWY